MEEDLKAWHLDKRVPVAIIFSLILQSAAIVWWASGVTSRLETVERAQGIIVENQKNIIALQSDQRSTATSLVRIETKLDRLIERKNP